MKAQLSRLVGAVPLILLAAIAMVIWQQQRIIAANQTALTAYQQLAERAEGLANQVITSSRRAAENSIQLQREQDGLRAALSQREIDIGALQNEVAQIRDWADSVLPAGIAGLRARPAITGLSEYHDYLSRRDALHAGGRAPADERRIEPRP